MFVSKLRKKIVAVTPPFLVRIIEYMVRQIRSFVGIEDLQWLRVVMDKETAAYVSSLNYQTFDALEISGIKWANFGFQSYRSVDYPEYDLCQGPLSKEVYDIIIAEQVLEHCLWPYRAVRHLYEMLRPGGVVVLTTPFLVRVHDYPVDCSRWTELGLKHLLAEGRFPLDKIRTGSWGTGNVWSQILKIGSFGVRKNILWSTSLSFQYPFGPLPVRMKIRNKRKKIIRRPVHNGLLYINKNCSVTSRRCQTVF